MVAAAAGLRLVSGTSGLHRTALGELDAELTARDLGGVWAAELRHRRRAHDALRRAGGALHGCRRDHRATPRPARSTRRRARRSKRRAHMRDSARDRPARSAGRAVDARRRAGRRRRWRAHPQRAPARAGPPSGSDLRRPGSDAEDSSRRDGPRRLRAGRGARHRARAAIAAGTHAGLGYTHGPA